MAGTSPTGDRDGDGWADVFLYHATKGAWSTLRSDGQGGFAATSGTWSLDWALVGRE